MFGGGVFSKCVQEILILFHLPRNIDFKGRTMEIKGIYVENH